MNIDRQLIGPASQHFLRGTSFEKALLSSTDANHFCVVCDALVADSRPWVDTCSQLCKSAKNNGISREKQDFLNGEMEKKMNEIQAGWTNKIVLPSESSGEGEG